MTETTDSRNARKKAFVEAFCTAMLSIEGDIADEINTWLENGQYHAGLPDERGQQEGDIQNMSRIIANADLAPRYPSSKDTTYAIGIDATLRYIVPEPSFDPDHEFTPIDFRDHIRAHAEAAFEALDGIIYEPDYLEPKIANNTLPRLTSDKMIRLFGNNEDIIGGLVIDTIVFLHSPKATDKPAS